MFEICNTHILACMHAHVHTHNHFTDHNKECFNFISRINCFSSFFFCQFSEKSSQKAVFMCKKSCQNSSRNDCVLFIYLWCRIINDPQPTMNTCFLQNTLIVLLNVLKTSTWDTLLQLNRLLYHQVCWPYLIPLLTFGLSMMIIPYE